MNNCNYPHSKIPNTNIHTIYKYNIKKVKLHENVIPNVCMHVIKKCQTSDKNVAPEWDEESECFCLSNHSFFEGTDSWSIMTWVEEETI